MVDHGLTLRRTVPAPPARVWEVLTDLHHIPEVLSGVTRVEVLTTGPYAVGTRWRETRRMLGREGSEEMEVTATDPSRSTVVEATSGGTHYRTTFTLTPVGTGGTLLTMEFTGSSAEQHGPARFVARLVGGLGLRVTRKVMERDLADIAVAASARG